MKISAINFVKLKILVLFVLIGAAPVFAQVSMPEKVRIGLYCGKSAMPIVSIKAQNGVTIGYNENSVFNSLYTVVSSEGIIVRKDAYFVKSGSLILEFKQTDSNVPNGEKFGPYHVQIGSAYSSRSELDKEMERLESKNIRVYPFYNGSWFIWHGLYLDASSAQRGIDTVLESELPGEEFTIIQPSARRVQVLAGDQVKFMFEGQDKHLTVKPESSVTPQLINVNGKNFRGEVEVRRYSDSDMTIINILLLEEYLYGVVPKEIGASSPIEAIKAQAVAARNYAIQSIGKNSKWGFDMTNTQSDQVYGGYELETPNSNRGVDETRGKKLLYNGKLASVFYFSTSGGRTEDVRNVWNPKADFPYLLSVEDKYESTELKYSKWEVTLTGTQIKDKLKLKGYDLGDIVAVQPLEYSEAGRVLKLLIKGTKGEETFEREECRTILGKEILSQWYTVSSGSSMVVVSGDGTKSTMGIGSARVLTANGVSSLQQSNSKVYVQGSDGIQEYDTLSSGYTFNGRGWGHGIGMSQNGAIGMAKAGFTYDQILQWYFKGTYIE